MRKGHAHDQSLVDHAHALCVRSRGFDLAVALLFPPLELGEETCPRVFRKDQRDRGIEEAVKVGSPAGGQTFVDPRGRSMVRCVGRRRLVHDIEE